MCCSLEGLRFLRREGGHAKMNSTKDISICCREKERCEEELLCPLPLPLYLFLFFPLFTLSHFRTFSILTT